MRRPLGQHFLFDPRILKKIIDCGKVTPEDTVVEIGPGLGKMTRLLAERVKKVIAIEIDKRLADRLKETLFCTQADSPGRTINQNIEVITADALNFPYETIKGKFKVIANIPYYITTPLLFRLLKYRDKIISMTLLLQKEVARRIVAVPGNKDYGILSISAQLYTKPALGFSVSRGAFSPPPDVDSAVVHFEVYPQTVFKLRDEEFFFKVVKTAFSQRRKTIANSLKSFKNIREALSEAGIDPKLRPESLSIRDFIKLSDVLQ